MSEQTPKRWKSPDEVIEELRGIVDECAIMLPWLMGWAEAWHRDAGGYTASDTAVGLERCRRLLADLKPFAPLKPPT